MGQFIFFSLFIITLLVGAYAYVTPSQKVMGPINFMIDNNSDDNPVETTSRNRFQDLNITINRGLIQVRRQMDETSQEQKKLIDMINDEQKVLNHTHKEIAGLIASGKSDKDLLRLKLLGLELQDDQRLLVAHGQALIALNDKLTKSRQLLADQNDLVNINNQSSVSTLQQGDALPNDQDAMFFDKVKQQSNDLVQRTQDLIEEERQRTQDRQNNQ